MLWTPLLYTWIIISQPFHIPNEILWITDVTDPLCGPTKSSAVQMWFTFSSVSSLHKYSDPHTENTYRQCSVRLLRKRNCLRVDNWCVYMEGNHSCVYRAVEKGTHHGVASGMTNIHQGGYSWLPQQIFRALSLKRRLSNIWAYLFRTENWTCSQPFFVTQSLQRYAKSTLTHPRCARYKVGRAQNVLTLQLHRQLSTASLFKHSPLQYNLILILTDNEYAV